MREDQDDKYKNNRQGKRFSIGIKIYFFTMTMLILVIFTILWVSLSRYQKKIDGNEDSEQAAVSTTDSDENEEEKEKAAQECFLDYTDSMTADTLLPFWYEKHPEKLDTEENIKNFLTEKIVSADYECYKNSDFDLASPKYTIMDGDERLADFTLSGSGTLFLVSNVDILIEGEEEYSAKVPEGFTMSVNGGEVPLETALQETETVTVEDYDEDLVNARKLCSYTVTGLISAPEPDAVMISSPEGKTAELAADDVYYEVMDTEDATTYSDAAESFVESLLNYYTKGKENAEENMNAVLGHVASGSSAAKTISGSLAGVVWMSADYTASYDLSVSNVYVLADNCCCVDVYYEQTGESKLYNTGNGTYRVYLLDSGNGYKIVQFAAVE